MMEEAHRITEAVLRKALAKQHGVRPEDVTVTKFDVTGGSNKGDNYACEMKAVSVTAKIKKGKSDEEEENDFEYMAKCFPMNEMRVTFLKKCNIFKTEVIMYSDLIPKLQKLEPRLSAPKTFFADHEEGIIIMENLKKKGYYIIDKQKGLTLEEVRLTLTQLAWLHATSYHMLQTYPGGQEQFKKDYPNLATDSWVSRENQEMAETMDVMFANNDEVFRSVIKEFAKEKGRSTLAQRTETFSLVRKDKVENCHTGKGVFSCVIHNDSWFNNFMYRRDGSGLPVDVKTLDLQLSRVARPSIDLAYFFGSSTTVQFRREHMQDLMRFYHATLVHKLNQLGYEGEAAYPFFELMKDFGECRPFGFVMSIMHAMVHLVPPDSPDSFSADDFGADDLVEMQAKVKEGMMRQARTNQRLRERFLELAEEAVEVGII